MAFGVWAASHLLRYRPGRRKGLERAPFDLRRATAPAGLANPGSRALRALRDGWAFTQPQLVQGTRVTVWIKVWESTRYQNCIYVCMILHFSIRQWTEEINHTSSKLYRVIYLSDESNVNYTGCITLVIVKFYDIRLCSKYISMSSIHIVWMIHYIRKILVSFMILSKYQHQSCEEHYRNLSDKKKNSYILSTVLNYLSLGK